MKCLECETILSGRQTKFCSSSCKGKNINNRHKDYEAQRQRGWSRKKQAVLLKGGVCVDCGYSKNLAALCFHHEASKSFGLDLRSFSNRSWAAIETELAKCILLCHNCHMERHHPNAFL